MTTRALIAVADLLRRAFPDPAIQITTTLVEAALTTLATVARDNGVATPHGFELDDDALVAGRRPDTDLITVDPDHRVMDYWLAHARHSRTAPVESAFTGQLPSVRVVVEDGWDGAPIETRIGTVYAGDHKLFSFTECEQYLAEVSATLSIALPQLSHVELVTPARVAGTRFAAIAVYIFCGPSAHEPFAYALEAGMATGEARVTYFAPSFTRRIVRKSHYHPTPFSSPEDFYEAQFHMTDLHEPARLDVKVRHHDAADPHMAIGVSYERVTDPECVYPAVLTFQAACRVAAIAEASGVPFPDLGPLAPLFAAIGRDQYVWAQKPVQP